MKEKLIEMLGLEPEATEDEIVSSVGYLMRVANSPGARAEKAIREKMGAGLSREAAIQVLKDQEADDELREEREAQEAEAKRNAAKIKAAADSKTKGDAKTTETPTV